MSQRLNVIDNDTGDIPSLPAPVACPFYIYVPSGRNSCEVTKQHERDCHYLSPQGCPRYARGIMDVAQEMRVAAARVIALKILETKNPYADGGNGRSAEEDESDSPGTNFTIPTTLASPLPELPHLPKPKHCPFVTQPEAPRQCGDRFPNTPVCHPWEPQYCTGYAQGIKEWVLDTHTKAAAAVAETVAQFNPERELSDSDAEQARVVQEIMEQLGL